MNDKANTIAVAVRGDREVTTSRVFEAPAKLVFDCHTKPELVRRWLLGPDGWSMPVCEIDLRVGGSYRYLWRKDDGSHEFGMTGTYREIAVPTRIVNSERFDASAGMDTGEATITTTFAEKAGRTTVTLVMLFPSKEARDGAVASGMTGGMEKSYQRLEAVLAKPA